MRNYTRIARQLMLIASRLLEAGKKERFDEYTSILRKKKFDQDEIDDILEKIDGLQPAKKERVALHWIINDALELPKDAKKLNKAFEYLELYKKKFEDYDDPDELIKFGEKRDIERIVVDDFNPDMCPEFSNKQKLRNGIVIYDVEDTWEGMMAVRAAMDTSWGYNGGKWCLATRDHGKMDRAWKYWNNYNAYQKRIAYKNGKVYMFCANSYDDELAWWNKNDKKYNYLPGAFDERGYELIGNYLGMTYDPKITTKDLMALAEHKNDSVRKGVADNSETPAETLKMLANDRNENVRYYVAENPNTPAEALMSLANDEDERVRDKAASHPNTPVETLEILANDKNYKVRKVVAWNCKTPAEVLKILANDESESVRCYVAYNPNTPVEALKLLANDENKDVRYYVAKNPNTPVEALKLLANDEDNEVKSKAIQNPNVSAEMLKEFARNVKVRHEVAKNPNASAEMLKKLAKEENWVVRYRVAENPNTPAETLKKLANDEDWNVRKEVALNRNTPVETLKMLANDKDERVKIGVILNPNTPVEALKLLANDKNRNIKNFGLENLKKR